MNLGLISFGHFFYQYILGTAVYCAYINDKSFFVFADVVHASISDSSDLSESFAKVSTKKKTNEEKDGIHSGIKITHH